MKRKPGLSLADHQRIAAEMAAIRNHLLDLCVELGSAYPKTGPRSLLSTELDAALDAVDRARAAGAGWLRKHPSDFDPHIYYPGPDVATLSFRSPREPSLELPDPF